MLKYCLEFWVVLSSSLSLLVERASSSVEAGPSQWGRARNVLKWPRWSKVHCLWEVQVVKLTRHLRAVEIKLFLYSSECHTSSPWISSTPLGLGMDEVNMMITIFFGRSDRVWGVHCITVLRMTSDDCYREAKLGFTFQNGSDHGQALITLQICAALSWYEKMRVQNQYHHAGAARCSKKM